MGNIECLGKTQLNRRETIHNLVRVQLTVPLYEATNVWSESRQAEENVRKALEHPDDIGRQAVSAATRRPGT